MKWSRKANSRTALKTQNIRSTIVRRSTQMRWDARHWPYKDGDARRRWWVDQKPNDMALRFLIEGIKLTLNPRVCGWLLAHKTYNIVAFEWFCGAVFNWVETDYQATFRVCAYRKPKKLYAGNIVFLISWGFVRFLGVCVPCMFPYLFRNMLPLIAFACLAETYFSLCKQL